MAKDKVHEIMDDPDEINFGCDVLSSTLFQRKYLHESVLCEKDNFQMVPAGPENRRLLLIFNSLAEQSLWKKIEFQNNRAMPRLFSKDNFTDFNPILYKNEVYKREKEEI